MPRYINTDELLETLDCAPVTMSVCLNVDECKGRIYERERVLRIIKEYPTADVRPVVRGEWKVEKTRYFAGQPRFVYHCSRCGSTEEHVYPETRCSNYCPNCGADMRT